MAERGIPATGDAWGHALLAASKGDHVDIVLERDDGLVAVDQARSYFAPLDDWNAADRWALDRTRGRVLDLGAGTGRAALELQARGQPVVGLDNSPGAVDVCRQRGVRDVVLGTVETLLTSEPARFDSVLAIGNNLGLLGSRDRVSGKSAQIRPGTSPIPSTPTRMAWYSPETDVSETR